MAFPAVGQMLIIHTKVWRRTKAETRRSANDPDGAFLVADGGGGGIVLPRAPRASSALSGT